MAWGGFYIRVRKTRAALAALLRFCFCHVRLDSFVSEFWPTREVYRGAV